MLFVGKNWNLNQNMSLWVRFVRGRRMGCADYVFVGKNGALLFEGWVKLGVLFMGKCRVRIGILICLIVLI